MAFDWTKIKQQVADQTGQVAAAPTALTTLQAAPTATTDAAKATTANAAATNAAIGTGIQMAGNAVDPQGVGLGSALGSAGSMGMTGFSVGGPTGAIIGGTIGLATGLMGANANASKRKAQAEGQAMQIEGQGLQDAGNAMKNIRLSFGAKGGSYASRRRL